MLRVCLLTALVLSSFLSQKVEAAEPRLISSDVSGSVIEVHGLDYVLQPTASVGFSDQRLTMPGGVIGTMPGHPAIPTGGALLGIPYGTTANLQIIAAEYDEIEGVDVMPTPAHSERGLSYDRDPNVYASDAWFPPSPAVLGRDGVMRDQRVQGVSLHPLQYNPAKRRLRVARKLRIRVSYESSAQKPSLRPAPSDPLFESSYDRAILNVDAAKNWRGRGLRPRPKQALTWYDPNSDWFRIPITEDGVYQLDADWFEASGIDLAGSNASRLQIFVEGEEVPLMVVDGGDDTIDDGDRVLFWAQYRRASDRDMENQFGRTRTYWLRFGSQSGLRYSDVDATPLTDAGETTWVPHTIHSEIDSVYERWGEAVDTNRDNWFYKRTASPSSPGGQEFPVETRIPLPGLVSSASFESTVRVGMHGLSLRVELSPDHRTLVEAQEGILLSEDRFDGQESFIAEGQLDAQLLTDTTLVTLRTPGSPEYPFEPLPYVDHVRLNWITVTYPRSLSASNGQFVFEAQPEASGTNFAVNGLELASGVTILDVNSGRNYVNWAGEGSDASPIRFSATQAGRLVTFDERAVLAAPVATPDRTSTLRSDLAGASYVIISHEDFLAASEQLAEHRSASGLSSVVVDVQDIYDEFNFGDLSETAIQDFVKYAFENWTERPVYVLLMGRMTYDYRDIMDQFKNRRVPKVPAMPFQSVRRGKAFTDHLYGTVSGDDPLMDVWVGRFSVNRSQEAETVVAKAIAYDQMPDAVWRDRVLYMANWDAIGGADLFIKDSNKLISDFAEPLGLSSFPVYHDQTTPPEPNESSNEVIRQFNEGRLIVNFMGHGSAASMSRYIAGTFQQRGFNYMAQIKNADQLPLVIAMSCLNGLYDEPTLVCFAEEMVNKRDGGSIGFVSASSLAFVFVNNEVNQSMFRYTMQEGVTEFGAALGLAKTDLLTRLPLIQNAVMMMGLMGDPAQKLAIPSGSDFVVETDGIAVTSESDALSTSDTARVSIQLRNDGIKMGTELSFAVIDRNLDTGAVDTIAISAIPTFGQTDSTAVLWPLAGRVGRHQVEVLLDPSLVLNETRRDNNQAAIEVEVFGRLSAVQAFPIESQAVSASVSLGVRTGILSDELILGELEVSQDPGFEGSTVQQSGQIPASEGLAIWSPGNLAPGVWFWRARMTDGTEDGAYSVVRSFSVGSSAPARTVSWRQNASEAFRLSEKDGIITYDGGTLGRTLEPLPLRITAEFREETITADGAPSTAVLATDGSFHFVKGFYSLPQIYPDSDTYLKVGSGLNGTTAGEVLGAISDPEIPSVSATYHGDGFIYSDSRKSREVVRISPSTGETTVIPVEAGLLEIRSALVFNGHSLFTSDGSLIYNVANAINGIPRAGWTVRVFDPEADWDVVREFLVDPTSTGFTFAFTDGVLADGEYLYLIEFGTGSSHRVRVVDAIDGTFVEEYQSDQAETDLLSGQYDWVNNKVWFGQLTGNQIHRYAGRRLPEAGTVTSLPIGPSSAWKSLSVDVSGASGTQARVDLLGEAPDGAFLPIAEWSDLPAGDIDLTELDTSIDRIQMRLRLSGPELAQSAALRSWSANYQPVSDISITQLEMSTTEVEELETVVLSVNVTNRGPIDESLGAVVAFYAGDPDGGRIIGRQAVPEDTPIGTPRRVVFAWNTAQFAGTHLVTARVEDLFGNEAFFKSTLMADSAIEIQPSSDVGLPTIDILAVDASGEIRSGDYLPADTEFQIVLDDSSGIERASVEILMTSPEGELPVAGIGSNLVSQVTEGSRQTSFRYSPPVFDDGTHTLAIRTNDRIGNGPATKAISFEVTSDLRLESVLNYPNPMASETDFTFVLSRPSEVTIKIYTVAGRLIRVIDRSGRAGYNQVHWDGLDSQGRVIANGTYLYTVTADDGESRVRKREKVIVYR
jgi:hypothetical protein